MKDKLISLSEVTFHRRIFSLSHAERVISRVVFSIFFVVCIGLTVALLISDVEALRWWGGLLLLIILDHIFHLSSSHYRVRDLFLGRVPKNNVGLCIDRKALRVLINAFEKASLQKGDLHVALFSELLKKSSVVWICERLEIDISDLRKRVADVFEETDGGQEKEEIMNILKTIALHAGAEALIHKKDVIGDDLLFAGIVSSPSSHLARIFDVYNLKPEDISIAIAFGIALSQKGLPAVTGGFAKKLSRIKAHRVNRTLTSKPTPHLDGVSDDITDIVRSGRGGFLIGHSDEYQQVLDVLSKSGQRNVLLVGEAGVGKEAIVHHLAFQILSDAVPGELFDRRVVSLSLGRILSLGGDDIYRILGNIVSEISQAGNIILFIPDIHLLEKTQTREGVRLFDVLTPLLRNGLFPVIGTTTPHLYSQYIDMNKSLSQLFERIPIQEMSVEDATRLLVYDAVILEKQLGIRVTFAAVRSAVELASRYITQAPLPSSAQEILREVFARVKRERKRRMVKESDVVALIEERSSIPIQKASTDEASDLLHLEDRIHERYINQDEAVIAVSEALRSYRSGLSSGKGPIASFLFVGPTGVGKTELSKSLASLYFGSEKLLVRFDMSEYQEKGSIQRFIGSSDGKIVGAFSESVAHHPYSIILLDEFEKAHPDILQLFLQVLDEGFLTDVFGRKIDFSHTIIIATSNAHSVFIQNALKEGKSIESISEDLKGKLSDLLRPELVNRFSSIVVFKPLSFEHIRKIARLQLASLAKRIHESNGIRASFSEELVSFISQEGFDPSFGARPLKRAIEQYIVSFLSRHILSGTLQKGMNIVITIEGEKTISFKEVV